LHPTFCREDSCWELRLFPSLLVDVCYRDLLHFGPMHGVVIALGEGSQLILCWLWNEVPTVQPYKLLSPDTLVLHPNHVSQHPAHRFLRYF